MLVFLGIAAFDEIAREDRKVRHRIKTVERRYGPFESSRRIDHAHQKRSRPRNVSIADLGY
jgi:hypothetical protein